MTTNRLIPVVTRPWLGLWGISTGGDALENAKRKYEHQMGLKRRPTEEFRPGDRVLLSTQNLKLKVEARKLTSKFVGPFEVLAPPPYATNWNAVF